MYRAEYIALARAGNGRTALPVSESLFVRGGNSQEALESLRDVLREIAVLPPPFTVDTSGERNASFIVSTRSHARR
jgi:hypothetical protein